MATTKMDRDQVLTEQDVDKMIANGDIIVIFQDYVLRLNSWMANHPGGSLAILHMVGRDATNEITSYHKAATLKTMKAFRIGRKRAGHWINKTPPIRGGYQQVPSLASDASEKTAYTLHIESDQDGSEPQDQGVTPVDDTLQIPTDSLSPPDSPPRRDQGLGTACSRASSRCSRRAVSGERRFSDGDEKSSELPFLHDVEKEPLAPKPRFNMTPKEYTEFAIKQGQRFDSQDYPSVDMDVQQAITEKYMALHQQVSDQGLYNCPYIEYGKECVRYLTIFALFIVTLRQGWYFTSALFLGLFWHQIMFTAHDAGHRAITTIFAVDTLIGMFIADFCCGLSIGWWKSSHNVHHLITNQPEHDPDIQNVPLFATCPSFFKSISSSYYEGFVFYWDAVADYMVPYQKYTYYPVMGIARFNLYLLSWLHVLSKKSTGLGSSKAWWIRPTEIAFMAGYWFVFGYLLLWRTLPDWPTRVMFVLVSHIVTMPLHVQITLSHWGMSTSDLGENESFPQRQLRTTMDVDCPAWLDFIHGGLQFQAVHHLFPRVPRHNLRKVQTMVRKFCDETEIPYSILGFVDGNRKVLSRLDQVSEQVKILASCQKYMAETGESGLH